MRCTDLYVIQNRFVINEYVLVFVNSYVGSSSAYFGPFQVVPSYVIVWPVFSKFFYLQFFHSRIFTSCLVDVP